MAYAIVKDNKIYRITFSKSLADLISEQTGMKTKRVKLYMGEEIEDIKNSEEIVFAICKKESGWPLRITFFKDAALLWKSDTTKICSCRIQLVNEKETA